MITRMFKRVNLLGLDFYVDWIDETGEFIAIKEVHSGKRFVFEGLMSKDGKSVADLFRDACGIKPVIAEKKEEVAPAALETEQPKEDLNAKKRKGRNRKVQE